MKIDTATAPAESDAGDYRLESIVWGKWILWFDHKLGANKRKHDQSMNWIHAIKPEESAIFYSSTSPVTDVSVANLNSGRKRRSRTTHEPMSPLMTSLFAGNSLWSELTSMMWSLLPVRPARRENGPPMCRYLND